MPSDSVLDRLNLPIPAANVGRLVSSNGCEYRPSDLALRRLCGALFGIHRLAADLGIDRSAVDRWLVGRRTIPLRHVPRLAELARQQGELLLALAVRLETVDRPVLEERRRIVRERARQRFYDRFGYMPEENQILKRLRPPSSG